MYYAVQEHAVVVRHNADEGLSEKRVSAAAGNNKFKRAFQALLGSSFRVVHSSDPIPNFPLWKCVSIPVQYPDRPSKP